jgi:hypothetical protein
MLAFVAGATVAPVGCAAGRAPVNQVQPNAIPKSFFLGPQADYSTPQNQPEFYARTMIIDVPFGAPSDLFANGFNATSRIKWEIQEKVLLGRAAYEEISGTDGLGARPTINNGQIVYAFAVQSQFDIERAYNQTTGENLNVVVENTTDRPWYARDYIRVDFSKNLNTSAYTLDTLAMNSQIQPGGVQYEPVGYSYTDPRDPNAMVVDLQNGYLDATDVVLATPGMIDLPAKWGGGSIPACEVPTLVSGGTAPIGLCNAADLTLRHSFKKVVPTDYQPFDYDGFRFQNFGAFTNTRYGYVRQYGLPDADLHRFVQRYNIWQRSHYYKNASTLTDPTMCTVDADCAMVDTAVGVHGSTCDAIQGICTLPFRRRTSKPVVWHYQDGGDPIYFEATRDAATDWDTAMRIAVSAMQRAECNQYKDAACTPAVSGEIAEEDDALKLVREVEACKRGESGFPTDCDRYAKDTASKRGYSDAVVGIATQSTPMVVLCHSPVTSVDSKLCGAVGTVARAGDLRFNLVSSIVAPNSTGFWGIMTDADDPVTGEKVSSSINIFTQPTEQISQSTVDVLRYIAGELKASDLTEGTYLDEYVAAAKQMASMQAPGFAMDAAEQARRMAAPFGVAPEDLKALSKPVPAGLQQAIVDARKRLSRVNASADVMPTNAPKYLARMSRAAGTPFEAALITQPMMQLGGVTASSPTGAAAAAPASASILGALNPTLARQYLQSRELAFASAGMCALEDSAADTAPLSDPALGDLLQSKFGSFNPQDAPAIQLARSERMRDFIRRRMHVGVIIHEMGHSFGLRHNFVSSSSAYNFRPQYWQLRTNDGQMTTACAGPVSDGKLCVGPRRFDPVTSNEMGNMIGMWAQSSVMEYPGDSTQDLLTLGAYDFAAVRAFYGDVATVYTDASLASTTANGKLAIDQQASFGGILGFQYHLNGDFAQPVHYSQLQGQLGLIGHCAQVKPTDFRPPNWNEKADGNWSALLDGFLVTNESGQTTRCKVQPVDYVPMTSLTPALSSESSSTSHPFQADSKGRTRVPYGFASDNWADLGNSSVYRHDNGADAYELMNFWIAQQEANHVFANYRRGRAYMNVRAAYDRTLTRYHEKMRDTAKGLGLYVNIARDTASSISPTDGDAFAAEVVAQVAPDLLIASSMAFDQFAHVFARPEPGDQALAGLQGNVLYSTANTGFANPGTALVTLPNGVFGTYGQISLSGRPIENALPANKGDYDSEYVQNVGSYYEKAYAAMLFTESVDNFISSAPNDFIDPRQRSVSMADLFPEGFRRWLGNNLTGDDFIKGVRIAADASGTPTVSTDGANAPSQGIGWTSWWPAAGVSSCFPGPNTTICQDPNTPGENLGALFPAHTAVVDAQVGWEQQKFAIAMTLAYLPENQKQNWISQLYIWALGADADPGFPNRIEFHDPNGPVLIARTLGTETVFGEVVQMGISARILEWANFLMSNAYVTTAVTHGDTTWFIPTLGTDGQPQVLDPSDPTRTATIPNCAGNAYCVQLQNYMSVPAFMRQAIQAYGLDVELRGVY